ncbi:MAG: hypothetical protein IPM29_26090 [Planctomycetes bacterium]|nr:hypothetical protein [Planctomycetota bacterium]
MSSSSDPNEPSRRVGRLDVVHFALALVALAVALPSEVFLDDAFITFRYAKNLAAGDGLVFNPGEPILGTTTPLFAMLLAGLHAATSWSFTNLAAAVHVGALAALGPLLRRMFAPSLGAAAGWLRLTPYVLACMPLVDVTIGMESTLFVAVSVSILTAALRDRATAVGLLAPIVCMLRPDGVVAAGLAFMVVALRRRRIPWRALGVALAVGLPWCAYAYVRYGSAIPITVGAKFAQTDSGTETPTFGGYLVAGVAPDNLGVVGLALAAIGVLMVGWRRSLAGAVFCIWGVVYNGLFAIAGVGAFFWYYVPFLAQTTALALVGWAALFGGLVARGAPARRLRWHELSVGIAALSLALLLGYGRGRDAMVASTWDARFTGPGRESLLPGSLEPLRHRYLHIGLWMRDHTPAHFSLAATEVGMLGFYSEHTIVDFLGLVTAEVGEHVASGDHLRFALESRKPELVLQHPDGFVFEDGLTGLLAEHYVPVQRVEDCEIHLRWPSARDETAFAAEVAAACGEPGTALTSIAFESFPRLLDFAEFRAEFTRALPAVGVHETPRGVPTSHVARILPDGRVTVLPRPADVALSSDGADLAVWSVAGAVRVLDAQGVVLPAAGAASLSRDLEVTGPLAAVELRLHFAPGTEPQFAGSTVTWHSALSPRPAFPPSARAAWPPAPPRGGGEVVVRIDLPAHALTAQDTLTHLSVEPITARLPEPPAGAEFRLVGVRLLRY